MHLLPFSSCLLRSSSLIGLTASRREKGSQIERGREDMSIYNNISIELLRQFKRVRKLCRQMKNSALRSVRKKSKDNGEKSEAVSCRESKENAHLM